MNRCVIYQTQQRNITIGGLPFLYEDTKTSLNHSLGYPLIIRPKKVECEESPDGSLTLILTGKLGRIDS